MHETCFGTGAFFFSLSRSKGHWPGKENAMKTEPNIPYKIYLEESELPRAWYNVRADMKNKPAPLLNPGTLQPMTDFIPTDADLQKGFDGIPKFPGNEI